MTEQTEHKNYVVFWGRETHILIDKVTLLDLKVEIEIVNWCDILYFILSFTNMILTKSTKINNTMYANKTKISFDLLKFIDGLV